MFQSHGVFGIQSLLSSFFYESFHASVHAAVGRSARLMVPTWVANADPLWGVPVVEARSKDQPCYLDVLDQALETSRY